MYEYYETPEQAAAFARRALALMDEHKVRLNPRNFAIWYSYACGNPPGLVRAVDAAFGAGQPYSEERGREVWERFLGQTAREKAVGEAGARLERQISDVMHFLDAAGNDVGVYGESLRANIERLTDPEAAGRVKEVIASLVHETRTMADRTRALEQQLQLSAKEAAELRQSLEVSKRDAMTDALTGIANRKHFDQALNDEAASAIAGGEPLSLLMADIDHFKRFNDTHGHPIGDQVLKLVARTLKETLKGRDTPARFGGEEFAIILPMTTLSSALVVAEQVRVRVGSRAIKRKDTQQQLGSVTLSIGATQYVPGESLADLVQRADEALYAAKGKGRNRVESQAASAASPAAAGIGAAARLGG